ncbi:hypothetical protein EOE67_01765 [Rheinheimera riviphila]|uniref:Uncharacterized protein n=2 Tax=Rheinheimera riviphila TaxID=1834037 RepID=A0A437R5N3_9GAMM|nr:hypothetical protein EOE67_01765 [Rheinheimera riviphila]
MKTEVPGINDWHGYQDDMDAHYAFKVFFGKTLAEMQPWFRQSVIERTDELRFMPTKAFQYYIFALRDYIIEKNYSEDDDDCAVDCLFNLVQQKINSDPGAILPVIDELIPALHVIAANVAMYNINMDIYGSIPQRLQLLLQSYQQLHLPS